MKLHLSLALIVFMMVTAYVIKIASKHSALHSFSASDYKLDYPWRWIWEAMLTFSGMAIIYLGGCAFDRPIVMLIMAGVGFIGVAVFARYNLNPIYRVLHNYFAYLGFGSLLLMPAISFGLWYVSLFDIVAMLCVYQFSLNKSIRVWNLEILGTYLGFAGLFGVMLWFLF